MKKDSKDLIIKYLGRVLGLFVLIWIAKLLWNYFAPMFNIVTLSYWQMWGLWILSNILIKPTTQISDLKEDLKNSDD